MKKYLFMVMLIALSCISLSAQNRQAASSTSKVPKDWLGHWQKGTFSLTSFEEQDGKFVGPANESSISYVIEENGMAKEYFITNTNTYNCRMQVLGYREGKLVSGNGNTFEFQPTSGYYYTVSCMNKTKTKKSYGTKDLYPEYSVKLYVDKDDSGAPVLVTKNAKATGELLLKKLR
jgi:hypothetical protein